MARTPRRLPVSKTIRLTGGRRARIKTVYVETPLGRTVTTVGGTTAQPVTTVRIEHAEGCGLGRVRRIRNGLRNVIGYVTTMVPIPWT